MSDANKTCTEWINGLPTRYAKLIMSVLPAIHRETRVATPQGVALLLQPRNLPDIRDQYTVNEIMYHYSSYQKPEKKTNEAKG